METIRDLLSGGVDTTDSVPKDAMVRLRLEYIKPHIKEIAQIGPHSKEFVDHINKRIDEGMTGLGVSIPVDMLIEDFCKGFMALENAPTAEFPKVFDKRPNNRPTGLGGK